MAEKGDTWVAAHSSVTAVVVPPFPLILFFHSEPEENEEAYFGWRLFYFFNLFSYSLITL